MRHRPKCKGTRGIVNTEPVRKQYSDCSHAIRCAVKRSNTLEELNGTRLHSKFAFGEKNLRLSHSAETSPKISKTKLTSMRELSCGVGCVGASCSLNCVSNCSLSKSKR